MPRLKSPLDKGRNGASRRGCPQSIMSYAIQSHRRKYTFDTLPEAKEYAEKVFQKSGAIVAIEKIKPPTIAVFRTFQKGGDVIALFPEIPGNCSGTTCESYMHVGQHGGAYPGCITGTRPATPEEIEPLKWELESLGYSLTIRKKVTRAMDEKRRANLQSLTH